MTGSAEADTMPDAPSDVVSGSAGLAQSIESLAARVLEFNRKESEIREQRSDSLTSGLNELAGHVAVWRAQATELEKRNTALTDRIEGLQGQLDSALKEIETLKREPVDAAPAGTGEDPTINGHGDDPTKGEAEEKPEAERESRSRSHSKSRSRDSRSGSRSRSRSPADNKRGSDSESESESPKRKGKKRRKRSPSPKRRGSRNKRRKRRDYSSDDEPRKKRRGRKRRDSGSSSAPRRKRRSRSESRDRSRSASSLGRWKPSNK
eukprot:CAMPEP_0119309732 /NCGR_PEP_ID=MMETSP1333-20130426/16311_1 /TAXON_ID=418940 /ORGANISM="Scyphosphaera apsteinii, Strain RCC1455" /LENGTH=263 /DNA_ID=CAMNT_0007313745 /DNA_START=86 /DNA_END=877 /DNA_ORIENTATION=+